VTGKIAIGASLLAMLSTVANPQEQGPSTAGPPLRLIVTYRCPPPRRAAFRLFLTENGMQRFERWKQDGVLQDYRVLFNWYVDSDTWDGMALLSFPSFAQVARWREIERVSPGGLPRDALELAWPFNSYPADDAFSESAQPAVDASRAVYFAIAYEYTNASEYRDFAGTYLIPQCKAWLHEGGLAGYDLYLTRYAAGKKWQALLVLQYRDIESFSRRDQVMAKVRAQLMKDPAWKALDEKKQKPGVEKELAVADPVLSSR
jgi:hypothetical protein